MGRLVRRVGSTPQPSAVDCWESATVRRARVQRRVRLNLLRPLSCKVSPVRPLTPVEGQRLAIRNSLEYGASNARSEATNTHLRRLTRGAYGYSSPDSLIARATLTRGGLNITLPGRAA